MASLHDEPSQSICAPSQIGKVHEASSTTKAHSREQRAHKRYDYFTMVMVTPLDDDLQPAGEPFPALTRNISTAGIGLVHSRPIYGRYVTFDLVRGNTVLGVIVEILRCNELLCGDERLRGLAVDDMCTYYESGGKFATDINVADFVSL